MMVDINLIAVLVAAVAAFVIAMAWYSQALFGKAWMQASGKSEADMKRAKEKGMGKTFIIQFVANVVMAYVLAYFVALVGAADFGAGVELAFWLWLGFMAPLMVSSVIWDEKPWKIFFICSGNQLVSLAVMAGILAIW